MIGFNEAWVERSPTNHYDERVVASVVEHVKSGSIRYRCKDEFWSVAHDAWCKAYREHPDTPQPMPEGHNMFLYLSAYGCVPQGCTDRGMRRRAFRSTLIANLNGWDRDLRKSIEGMKTLVRIINATLDAREAGDETGAFPYVACITASL